MLTRFVPFDRTFTLMDEWRRHMDRALGDLDFPSLPAGTFEDPWSLSEATWPRVNVHDTGTSLLFTAEVPGMKDQDLKIQLENDVLTVSGERKTAAPAGYTAHRRERGSASFTRAFTLPCKVDADRVNASLKDGVLSLEMPKVPEAKPRQIAIRGNA
jgi:HSP20 family protein